MERGMTCAARLKLNNPIASATTLAKMTRLRIYRPKPLKDGPAKLSFGSGGSGSATHLGCVLLNSAIGVNVQHVPYRGSAPALQDLVAGRINYLCDAGSPALPQIKAGTVKPLA